MKPPGTGQAYALIGKVPVMHEGRVKPLDTVAREEVKQVYGRETIKLHDPREEIDHLLKPEATRGGPRQSKSGGRSGRSSAGPSIRITGTTSPSSSSTICRSASGSWPTHSRHG